MQLMQLATYAILKILQFSYNFAAFTNLQLLIKVPKFAESSKIWRSRKLQKLPKTRIISTYSLKLNFIKQNF